MRRWEADCRFAAYGRIGVRRTIDDERANSGHARSHGTVPFNCKMRGKQALDRRVHLELREAQLLGKRCVRGAYALQRHELESNRQVLRLQHPLPGACATQRRGLSGEGAFHMLYAYSIWAAMGTVNRANRPP
jgi:hypothetical protein